jgi:energy-coupling factor transporter ATP-binding protein EcfA2
MLTNLIIRNFKRFGKVEIELGSPVVFVGPNNSGKTTALQALALWDIGVKRWIEKRKGRTSRERPGVTINRRDLIAVPVPDASLLWRNLHTRNVQRIEGKQQTQNVRFDITVEGVTDGKSWKCGLEFDYPNPESLYCRPLRLTEEKNPDRMIVPEEAIGLRVAFLPPMSGLATNETRLDPGAINVLLGEGRTAEVLRNLCYQIITKEEGGETEWRKVCKRIEGLFGVQLDEPRYIAERGEIAMTYHDTSGVSLDLSSSGRGLQQTLLLLAHLTVNPGSVLLLDEPDAHLEILRQRQIYQLLTESAVEQGSQIIAASHSEVVLNEAADRDVVVAFLGRPHRIDDRGSQLLKSLKEIGFDQYYQAAQTGWVLYLEGSTDLAILQAFAETLNHTAIHNLERPFVHYIENLPNKAREHFYGLREAKPDLVGFVLCDRVRQQLQSVPELREKMWQRREIENYLCQPETLFAYAEASSYEASGGPLFAIPEIERRRRAMQECIDDFVPGKALRDPADVWWINTKMSDDFLDRLFEEYFEKLNLPNLMRKSDYHVLARFVPKELIATEIYDVLDAIVDVSKQANPAPEDEET